MGNVIPSMPSWASSWRTAHSFAHSVDFPLFFRKACSRCPIRSTQYLTRSDQDGRGEQGMQLSASAGYFFCQGLRHHAEHGPAVQFEPAAVQPGELEIPDPESGLHRASAEKKCGRRPHPECRMSRKGDAGSDASKICFMTVRIVPRSQLHPFGIR